MKKIWFLQKKLAQIHLLNKASVFRVDHNESTELPRVLEYSIDLRILQHVLIFIGKEHMEWVDTWNQRTNTQRISTENMYTIHLHQLIWRHLKEKMYREGDKI